jgi:hypothetical protein
LLYDADSRAKGLTKAITQGLGNAPAEIDSHDYWIIQSTPTQAASSGDPA